MSNTLFAYNGVSVKASETNGMRLWIETKTDDKIINKKRYGGTKAVFFSYEYGSAEKAQKFIANYTKVAHALGEARKTNWKLQAVFQGFDFWDNFRFYREGRICKLPFVQKSRLTERRIRKFLKRLPQEESQSAKEAKLQSLKQIAQASQDARRQIVLQEATEKMSKLTTDEIMEVMEKINMAPNEADLAKLLEKAH